MAINGVFLDTNSFISSNFKYEDNNFESLFSICDEYSLSIYIDEIIKNEVLSQINKQVNSNLETFNNKHLKMLVDIYPSIDERKDIIKEKLKQQYIRDFKKLLSSSRIKIIPSNFDRDTLINMYFNMMPPFEEKKKEEFPDAISMLNLLEFIKQENLNIICISNDNGIKNFCTMHDIECFKYISEAIGKINDTFNPNEFFNLYRKTKIIEVLENALFEDDENSRIIDFDINGYYYDSELYAEEYSIEEINIKDVSIIHFDKNSDSFSVIANMELTFKIKTSSVPDYQHGSYDKEDGIIYTFDTVIKRLSITRDFELKFEINIEDYQEADMSVSILNKTYFVELEHSELDFAEDEVVDYNHEYR